MPTRTNTNSAAASHDAPTIDAPIIMVEQCPNCLDDARPLSEF